MVMGRSHHKKAKHAWKKPHWLVDGALVTIFAGELGVVSFTFAKEPSYLVTLLVMIAVVALAIKVTKVVSAALGAWFSRRFLQHLGDPLGKSKNLKKWSDQWWQLVIHLSMTALELAVLKNETWWQDTTTCWNQGSVDGAFPEHKWLTKMLYITQLAIWICTAVSCKFIEEMHKDYIVMMTHHVVTIALVTWSYAAGYLPVGVVVLFLHDVSDILLDCIKLANLCNLEGPQGFFIAEGFFAANFFVWFYFRVYLFPAKLLKTTLIENRESCMPMEDAHDWSNWTPCIRSWALFNGLLIALYCLHIWWTYLIFRIIVGVLKNGAHQAGRDEYEGTSDSDSDSSKKDD